MFFFTDFQFGPGWVWFQFKILINPYVIKTTYEFEDLGDPESYISQL